MGAYKCLEISKGQADQADETGPCSVVTSDRTRGSGKKPEQRKFKHEKILLYLESCRELRQAAQTGCGFFLGDIQNQLSTFLCLLCKGPALVEGLGRRFFKGPWKF